MRPQQSQKVHDRFVCGLPNFDGCLHRRQDLAVDAPSDELEAALVDRASDLDALPAQRMRTLHFVRTLVEEADRRNLTGRSVAQLRFQPQRPDRGDRDRNGRTASGRLAGLELRPDSI